MKHWLTASFLLMLALLAGGELIVRIFFAQSMSGRFEYGYSPTAGFVENADGTVNLVHAGGRPFWPQTFSMPRPPGIFRVMVVGDSVPRGSSLATSYATQIGEKLRALGIKAESFNLAIGGNGSARSEIILRKALDYQPSLIILHVDNGDEFEDEREFNRAEAFKSWDPKNWLMKSFFVRRLYEFKTEQIFWKWVPAQVRILADVNDTGNKVLAGENPATRREWDERVQKYTAESVALARARGVPVLLLTEARRVSDGRGGYSLDNRGLDDLVRPLLGDGVYFLSMKQLLQQTDFAPLFFDDNTHLRPPGHIFIADAIVRKLQQEKIVRAGK
jgi:lysophospholipase L1-like esterase